MRVRHVLELAVISLPTLWLAANFGMVAAGAWLVALVVGYLYGESEAQPAVRPTADQTDRSSTA
jgi:hypothetical protein